MSNPPCNVGQTIRFRESGNEAVVVSRSNDRVLVRYTKAMDHRVVGVSFEYTDFDLKEFAVVTPETPTVVVGQKIRFSASGSEGIVQSISGPRMMVKYTKSKRHDMVGLILPLKHAQTGLDFDILEPEAAPVEGKKSPACTAGQKIRFLQTGNEAIVQTLNSEMALAKYTLIMTTTSFDKVGSYVSFDSSCRFIVISSGESPVEEAKAPAPPTKELAHDFSNPYLLNKSYNLRECVNCGCIDVRDPGGRNRLGPCLDLDHRFVRENDIFFAMTHSIAPKEIGDQGPPLKPLPASIPWMPYGHLVGGPWRWPRRKVRWW